MTAHRNDDLEIATSSEATPESAEQPRGAYVAPRIVTHTAEELQKILLTVNAATDLNPFP